MSLSCLALLNKERGFAENLLNKGAAQKWYDYWTAIIMLTAKGDIDDRREVHTPWRAC
jgi:hypothetical protein